MKSLHFPYARGSLEAGIKAHDLLCAAFTQHTSSSGLPACIDVILGLYDEMCSGPGISKLTSKQSSKIYALAWRWITYPRSSLDIKALLESRCTCESDTGSLPYSDRWHRQGQKFWNDQSFDREAFSSPFHAPQLRAFESLFWLLLAQCVMPLSLAMISPEVHRTIQRPHRLHRRSE
jgi:hypothetical protein